VEIKVSINFLLVDGRIRIRSQIPGPKPLVLFFIDSVIHTCIPKYGMSYLAIHEYNEGEFQIHKTESFFLVLCLLAWRFLSLFALHFFHPLTSSLHKYKISLKVKKNNRMKSLSNVHFINWTINQSVDKLTVIALKSGRKPTVSQDMLPVFHRLITTSIPKLFSCKP
jgi:hypothetical protein